MSFFSDCDQDDIRFQLVAVALVIGKLVVEGRVLPVAPDDKAAIEWLAKLNYLHDESMKIMDAMPDDALH